MASAPVETGCQKTCLAPLMIFFCKPLLPGCKTKISQKNHRIFFEVSDIIGIMRFLNRGVP